jgi:hypothetical protein
MHDRRRPGAPHPVAARGRPPATAGLRAGARQSVVCGATARASHACLGVRSVDAFAIPVPSSLSMPSRRRRIAWEPRHVAGEQLTFAPRRRGSDPEPGHPRAVARFPLAGMHPTAPGALHREALRISVPTTHEQLRCALGDVDFPLQRTDWSTQRSQTGPTSTPCGHSGLGSPALVLRHTARRLAG